MSDAVTGHEPSTTERERFAMVAVSVTGGLRCGDCHRLYAYLDRRQGKSSSWAVKGAADVADNLVWQRRTAKTHLRHLADVGIIELDPEPSRGWGNTFVRVAHAPARGRYADLRPLPGVWEPEAEPRWRQPPRSREELDRLRSSNAGRDAPSVRQDGGARSSAIESANAWRDAPAERGGALGTLGATRLPEKARRARPDGVTRLPERSNAGRDAPCVPVSKRSEGGLRGFRAREGNDEDQPAPEVSAFARLEEAFGPSGVVETSEFCADCGAPADGQPCPDGTPMCRTHDPF